MNLSMSMLGSYLARYNAESSIQDDERSIHGVRFLSSGHKQSSHEYVYIGRASDYFEDPIYTDALILASGKNHILCRGSDYEELLNDVLSAFDYYSGLDQGLMKAATHGGKLEDMLDLIGEVIQAPILVFSIDGVFLAGIHFDALQNEDLRTNIEEASSLGAEVIGGYFTDEDGSVQHDLTNRARAMYGADGRVAVSRYLVQEDETVGFIMCFPLSKNDIGLAISLEEAFADYLAEALEFTDAFSPYQSRHRTLAELIAGKSVADESIARLANTIGSLRSFYLVCVKSLAIRNRTQRMLLATEIEGTSVSCLSCEVEEDVAFIVAERDIQGLIIEIERRFDAKSVAIGISMPMANVDQAPVAWRQALFASESNEEPGVRYCRDLALPFLLRVVKSEPASSDLLHPALATLAAYDASSKSELAGTLRAYVSTGCNQVKCARRLHVHLNTLKYRLGRICEITGLDFKDQDELLYLQLSIALQEMDSDPTAQ